LIKYAKRSMTCDDGGGGGGGGKEEGMKFYETVDLDAIVEAAKASQIFVS
jgi:hypothetical protein